MLRHVRRGTSELRRQRPGVHANAAALRPHGGPCPVAPETESGAHGALLGSPAEPHNSGAGDGVRVPIPKPTAVACLDQA